MSTTSAQPLKFDISKNNTFEIRGTQFHVPKADGKGRSRADSFAVIKGNLLLKAYADLATHNPKSIFEVGFFEGGSSVFLDRLYEPDQLTCVDLRADRIKFCDDYIEKNGRQDSFRMHYSVDQSDKATLAKMVQDHHGGSLDLAIDDASHEYFRSKATFEALFPFLKPGGVYLLEDYAWAHTPQFQKRQRPWKKQTKALSNLVFELTMIMATNPRIISRMDMDRASCRIYRGPQEIDEPFLVENEYVSRGNNIRLI